LYGLRCRLDSHFTPESGAFLATVEVGTILIEEQPPRMAEASKGTHQNGRSLLGSSDPICGNLIWLPANLFSGTLSRQGLLQSPLLARLQAVGVSLHFLDDVFRMKPCA